MFRLRTFSYNSFNALSSNTISLLLIAFSERAIHVKALIRKHVQVKMFFCMIDSEISVLWLFDSREGFSPFDSILSLGKCGEEMIRGWKIQQPRPLSSFQFQLEAGNSRFVTALAVNLGRDYCKSELLLAGFTLEFISHSPFPFENYEPALQCWARNENCWEQMGKKSIADYASRNILHKRKIMRIVGFDDSSELYSLRHVTDNETVLLLNFN